MGPLSLRLSVLSFASLLALGCAGSTVVPDEPGGPDASAPDSSPAKDASTADTSPPPPPRDAADGCSDGVKNNAETDVDCGGGTCPKCANKLKCNAPTDCQIGVCTGGICGACDGTTQCPIGTSCLASGFCAACQNNSDCGTQVCSAGSCAPCKLSSECGMGQVCNYGSCTGGNLLQMYQCPGPVSLGGGAWGFYGCQNQLTNTSTCNEIEAPTNKNFNCTAAGHLAIVTSNAVPPPNTKAVPMYQCPGPVSLGGGAWGFYGCQSQITNQPTCYEIEAPTTKTFNCTPIGTLMVDSVVPAAPPGGKTVPMFQCPGPVSLGGGAWGYYGCQNQLTNTSTCNEIEYPTSKNFNCAAAGNIVLEP